MRRSTALAAGLAALALVLGPLAWLRGWLTPATRLVAEAFAPAGVPAAADPDGVLREQVARLGAENAVLRARLAEYAAIQGEGGVPAERVVVARGRIIARTRRAGRRYVELDVGRVDGVAKGMAVTMGWTLVGQVAGTDDGRCLVQELTDSESRVAAAVLDNGDGAATPPARLCEGVAAGHGKRGELGLDFVDGGGELELKPGQPVVTAGSDGRFPANLVIGTITSASHAGTEVWQVAITQPRDPEIAESLLVIKFAR